MTYALVSGVVISGMYLLLALGFTVMLRIADIVNLAHGSFVLGGMFLVLYAVNDLGIPYALAVPAVVVAGLIPAWAIYRLFIKEARSEGHRPQIIYTLLMFSLFQVLFQMAFGSGPRTLNITPVGWTILGVSMRREQVIGFGVAVVVCIALALVFRRTAIGKSVEVAGKYPDGGEAIGLPIGRLYQAVFLIGSAMALLAGGLIISYTPATPFVGIDYLVIAVVIALTARLSFTGCVFASLLYGVGYQVLFQIFNQAGPATISIYGALLLLIAVTPRLAQSGRGIVTLVRRSRPAVQGSAS
jgi:branched-chain amino acid transport system permease protein